MFRYHVHLYPGELLCHLLKTRYCYIDVKYGFNSSYVRKYNYVIKGTTLSYVGVITWDRVWCKLVT
jgi:hypothetical protein